MNLKVKDLAITFESKEILKNLNLEITDGEFVAILGPSGCGKSTLVNIIAGILKSVMTANIAIPG